MARLGDIFYVPSACFFLFLHVYLTVAPTSVILQCLSRICLPPLFLSGAYQQLIIITHQLTIKDSLSMLVNSSLQYPRRVIGYLGI